MTDFQKYMLEEHGEKVSMINLHREDHPHMTFDRSGKIPTLYGDHALEQELGLAVDVRAVQSQSGIIHQVWDPTVVTPKFEGMHESSDHALVMAH